MRGRDRPWSRMATVDMRDASSASGAGGDVGVGEGGGLLPTASRPSRGQLWAVGFAAGAVLAALSTVQTVGLNLAKDQPPEVLRSFALLLTPWVAWALALPAI